MTRRAHHPGRLAGLAVLIAAGAVVAQTALDGSLNALGGRQNPRVPTLSAAPDLYSVSRETGELVYNRANAFNDNTYTIYQRYAVDRERYFRPASAPRAVQANTAAGVRAQAIAPVRTPTAAGASGLAAPTYRPTAHRAPASMVSRQSLQRVSYRVR